MVLRYKYRYMEEYTGINAESGMTYDLVVMMVTSILLQILLSFSIARNELLIYRIIHVKN